MIDAAVKSLAQILSPPMRSILWKAVGFALVLIVVVAVALQRLLSWFATWAQTSLDGMVDPFLQTPIHVHCLDRVIRGRRRHRARLDLSDAGGDIADRLDLRR